MTGTASTGLCVALAAVVAVCAELPAASVSGPAPVKDFPCWRGASGSGAASAGVQLIEDISKAKLLWKSDPTPGVYGSWIMTGETGPIVADGKVILVYHDPNDDVYDEAFVKQVVEGNSWKVKDFWDGKTYVDVSKGEPVQREAWAKKKFAIAADDVIHCFDDASGKTLWRAVFAKQGLNCNKQGRGAFISAKCSPQSIPCVAHGKVFAIGSSGKVYAVNLADGKTVWESDLGPVHKKLEAVKAKARADKSLPGYGRTDLATGPTYAGGVIACYDDAGGLVGFDPGTGAKKWTAKVGAGAYEASPIRWVNGGKEYVISGGTCVDPADGKVLWNATKGKCGENGTACVDGDVLIWGSAAYRITPQAATPVWTLQLDCGNGKINQFRTATPVSLNGFACVRVCDGSQGYGENEAKVALVDMATGTVVTNALNSSATGKAIGMGTENGSWIGGDGRAFLECGRDAGSVILMAVVDPKNFKVSALPVGGYGMSTTPCYANGRLYLRMQTHIACWDLRK